MPLRVSDDGEPAVVGDLQPLVSIGGPGVCVLQSPGQLGHLRDSARPETEGAIDVQPGVVLATYLHDIRQWIESAGVDLPGLGDDDGGAGSSCQRCTQRPGIHPAFDVRRYAGGLQSKSQVPQGGKNRHVRVLAHEYAHGRGALQSFGFDIPADARVHGAARGCQANEACHCGAGHESHGALLRQPQNVEQPAHCDLLCQRRGRRAGVRASVLAPGAREHIGGYADRM